MADPGKDDTETQARMDAFVSTTDGFELAEADLRTRHEGDVLGSDSMVRRPSSSSTSSMTRSSSPAPMPTRSSSSRPIPTCAIPSSALAADIERTFANLDETSSKGA